MILSVTLSNTHAFSIYSTDDVFGTVHTRLRMCFMTRYVNTQHISTYAFSTWHRIAQNGRSVVRYGGHSDVIASIRNFGMTLSLKLTSFILHQNDRTTP